MPVPSDSLASLCSIRLSREWLSEMPYLFERTSLPRTRLSRAWKSEMPSPLERWATLSISSLPSSGEVSRPSIANAAPPVSSAVLRSTRLRCDGSPAAGPLATTPIATPPPRFSSSRLPSTTLSLEPSICDARAAGAGDVVVLDAGVARALDPDALVAVGGDAVAVDQRVLRRVREPDALVVGDDGVVAQRVADDLALERGRRLGRDGQAERRVLHGRPAEHDGGLLVLLERELLDDVALGADVERDAPVELLHLAVADRDLVVAVVADAGADALAVDRVAVEVDRDVRRADDDAVEQAVGEVVQ